MLNKYYTHYFLFVSHGQTLSNKLTMYDAPFSDIDNINYFVDHGNILFMPSFNIDAHNEFQKKNVIEQFDIMLSTSKIIIHPKKNVFSIPSIRFYVYPNDISHPMKDFMGIWLVNYIDNTVTKIIDIYGMMELTYKNKFITYKIYKEIINPYIKDIKKTNNDYKIGLGFWACRYVSPQYLNEKVLPEDYDHYMSHTNINLKTQIINLIPKNEILYITPGYFFPPLSYKPLHEIEKYFKSWSSALSELTIQGCGLNVLAFWQFINQSIARENVLCLTKGTSIFKIIQFINNYLIRNKDMNEMDIDNKDMKWIILRFSINYLNIYLSSIINQKPEYIHQHIIIVKLYLNKQHNNEYSHIGHTISFYFININGSTLAYMVDPQNTLFLRYDTNEYNEWFKQIEKNNKYFDTIWINTEYIGDNTFGISQDQNPFGNPYDIVPYNNEVYGGSNNTLIETKSQSKSNKLSSARSNKSKKLLPSRSNKLSQARSNKSKKLLPSRSNKSKSRKKYVKLSSLLEEEIPETPNYIINKQLEAFYHTLPVVK